MPIVPPTKEEIIQLPETAREENACNVELKKWHRPWMANATQEKITYFRESDNTSWMVTYYIQNPAEGDYNGWDVDEYELDRVG